MSNISSAAACWPTADESFGPVVQDCRGDFDFTIAFEQYLFSILPACLLIIAAPLRLRHLSKSPSVVVAGNTFRLIKLAAVAVFSALQLSLLALWAAQPGALGRLITLAENLKILIQFWTSLETSIGAVARIKNFSEETPDERLPGEDQEPPRDWPARGGIEIRDLSAGYGEDLGLRALDGVALSIRPGEKVGVCGRTGSGKSSLLLSLLRLLPSTRGSVVVGGVDLATLPRDTVRSRLIAVSQDLFFLPGTTRQSLDPCGSGGDSTTSGADDARLEAVLRRVGLWEAVADAGGLGAEFDEARLSHGQRQLFSLARALLRRRGDGGVVLLDEATSSVDAGTDALAQRVVREDFASHTVVSVAHRLETIVDFDRVVVLEKGCVAEEGCPRELLARPGSRFKELWDASRRAGRVE
ncbi:hypothetical protein INS49_000087 [Diaporthe citri]|uniref:uncharacterized protein n=1 Tax=Diaporthe citri TaxID=83186 RepID=UPI001C8252B2|nr:uncharacterized protein INS49_000087 [Diaporthe citri]KAG6365911.1 hypothetical protein INS49_000087 [Diaporthe citri]